MTRPTAAPAHFPYAHRTLDLVDRDDRIVAEYVAGKTCAKLASDFDLSESRVGQIVKKAGVSRPRGYPPGKGTGTPIGWPECPKHLLPEYRTLVRYMKAAEARQTLEGRR